MNAPYDRFPSNLCESMGKIERKAFRFRYSKAEVWQGGQVIFSSSNSAQLDALLNLNTLLVTLDDKILHPYVKQDFEFDEISTNGDRVMWSKDLFDSRDSVEANVPDIMSLFYQGGLLSKVTFTVHEPNILIELHK